MWQIMSVTKNVTKAYQLPVMLMSDMMRCVIGGFVED